MSLNSEEKPRGEVTLRAVAMPADTNPAGDIFGGWLLSQMDLAGGTLAAQRAGGRVATVAVDKMTFHKPVGVGDVISCYTEIVRVGRTSLTVKIEAWGQQRWGDVKVKVTEGMFVFVALDEERRPRPIPPSK